MRPDDRPAFFDFLQQLTAESDRGLALIGGAFIDEKLAETLRALFHREADDLVFGKNAPLGTFSARIELCHALALIEDVERHDCDLIRRIRNEFAHKVLGTSFDAGRVRDLCGNLQSEVPSGDIYVSPSPRDRFRYAVLGMATRLFYRAEFVAREKRQYRTWVDPEQLRWRRTDEEKPPVGEPVLGTWLRLKAAQAPNESKTDTPEDTT